MFQPWFVELISVLSEIVVGICAVVAIIAGIFGFKKWRTELVAKAKLEVARKVAVLAQKFEDEFGFARSAIILPGECAERPKGKDEKSWEASLYDEYFARANRLETVGETWRSLRQARWEAEVTLDEGVGELIDHIEKPLVELYSALPEYFKMHLEKAGGHQEKPGWDSNRYVSLNRIVYAGGDDEFGKSVDAVVNALLEELKRYTK